MESRPVEPVSGAQGRLPFKNLYLYFPELRPLISSIPLKQMGLTVILPLVLLPEVIQHHESRFKDQQNCNCL